jgi:hypothetical protein
MRLLGVFPQKKYAPLIIKHAFFCKAAPFKSAVYKDGFG